jgi:RND family efflux transporter MFP subunit
MKRVLAQVALVTLVLALGVLGFKGLAAMKKPPERTVPPAQAPLVETMLATSGPFQPVVNGSGQVRPRRLAQLVPEVAGRIIWLAPEFLQGGLLKADQELVRLDQADLLVTLAGAQAELEGARAMLAQEDALSKAALVEQDLLGVQAPTDLALRKPQLAQALAHLSAAQARLMGAELGLKRSVLRAPFHARVVRLQAGLGQLVQRGVSLAELASTDVAEILIPVRDGDLGLLDMSWGQGLRLQPEESAKTGLADVRMSLGGEEHQWSAKLARIDGELDPRSRMVRLLLEVHDPYGLESSGQPPLLAGAFVKARIPCRVLPNVVVLPRAVIGPGNEVWVLQGESRLERRQVEILWKDRKQAVLKSGVKAGERVVVSPLSNPVNGMAVRLLPGEATEQ